MPIYEYRCDHCGHELEVIQKISEQPLTRCPACETEGLRKKISATVFRLKGSGWYETDFKSDKKRNVASAEDGAPKDGDKETDKGKDTGKEKGKDANQAQQTKPESDTGKSEKNGKTAKKTTANTGGDSSRATTKTETKTKT